MTHRTSHGLLLKALHRQIRIKLRIVLVSCLELSSSSFLEAVVDGTPCETFSRVNEYRVCVTDVVHL